ncbi:MAG: hypothetical protein AAF078_14835, partial [Planctomycetota bacterium]
FTVKIKNPGVSRGFESLRSLRLRGYLFARDAASAGDVSAVRDMTEFLHNLPSLINDPNPKRHAYFWSAERSLYLDRVGKSGDDYHLSYVRNRLDPILSVIEDEMKSLRIIE